jgi:ABC-type branched-subunit amino acid transport system ATPase component
MNYLSVEGLSKSWNEKVLFDQITFGLSRGEKVALIAGNGSGKILHHACQSEWCKAFRQVVGV